MILHVWSRAVDRQAIFRDGRDAALYARCLGPRLRAGGHALLGFVLMRTHFHLIVRVGSPSLSLDLHRAHTRFAMHFNGETGRTGPVFEDRFRARIVETDEDLMNLVRYIHGNPVAAGLVGSPDRWSWSGDAAYRGRATLLPVDTELVLRILAPDRAAARSRYRALFSPIKARTNDLAGTLIDQASASRGLDPDEFRCCRSRLAAEARAEVAAQLSLQGWSTTEIGKRLGLPLRTIQRLVLQRQRGASPLAREVIAAAGPAHRAVRHRRG